MVCCLSWCKNMVKVAVDTMGGDFAPSEIIKGAVQAAREGIEIILVGPEETILQELTHYDTGNLSLSVVNASEVIYNNESPVEALRHKPDSSLAVAIKLLKDGTAHAMVSMGSTGAVMACAKETLGILKGIRRPAMGGMLLGFAPHTVVFDMGANVDCKPQQLLGFGALGCAVIRALYGIANPTIGILSIGSEEGKGNRLVKETYLLLKNSSMNFVGNIEASDIPTGKVNVVVCDGFTGNVAIKLCEGLGRAMVERLKSMLHGRLSQTEIQEIETELIALTNITDVKGGGMLYGVDGIIVKGHGRYKAQELTNAVRHASTLVQKNLLQAIKLELAKYDCIIPDNVKIP